MSKQSRTPRTRPPKVNALTASEKSVLATMPVKYGVGRPSNKTKKLLATIAYLKLRLSNKNIQ